MTYALSADLQKAIYQTLKGNPALQDQIGDAIYDVVPAGQIPSTYVSLGPEDVRDWSDKTGSGARHDFTISVVTDAAGFQTAKAVAGAVTDALAGTNAALARGTLVSLSFRRARAIRVEEGNMRRIDLSFRALVADD
jgi:Protein of unknown function (DUF3168)